MLDPQATSVVAARMDFSVDERGFTDGGYQDGEPTALRPGRVRDDVGCEVMDFRELAAFDVVHLELAWPWVAIDAARTRIAFGAPENRIATRLFAEGTLEGGPTFDLPADLGFPTEKSSGSGHRGAASGVHAFAIAPEGSLLAVTGTADEHSIVVTLGPDGEKKRSRVEALTGGDFTAHAIAFDRSGTRLWVSAESGEETALLLLDARTHEVLGVLKSPAFPPPAAHELHIHPHDDAVLLLAACGQDGTFARVAGWSDGPPIAISTSLDDGGQSAGLVGFSADSSRVHLAEANHLRTLAWPGLEQLSSVELANEFFSNYGGVVLGERVLVDGEMDDGKSDVAEDAVMLFDHTGIRGRRLKPPVPTGMWVGKLGEDAVVIVDAKGEPAHARVVRFPAPQN